MKFDPNELDLHERFCAVTGEPAFPCDCRGKQFVEEVEKLSDGFDRLKLEADQVVRQFTGLLTQSRIMLNDARDLVSAWMHHCHHVEKGVHGCEKTIGSSFFDPRKHCDLCAEEWERRAPVKIELRPIELRRQENV